MPKTEFEDAIDFFFGDLLGILRSESKTTPADFTTTPLRSSISDTEKAYEVMIEAPGATQEMIDVQFKDDTVGVKIDYGTEGKIRSGKYGWTHKFKGVDAAQINAKLEAGILRLTLTKKPESQATKININV